MQFSMRLSNYSLLMTILLAAAPPVLAAPPTVELIDVKKIWDQAPHSAFTDLAHWNGQFVCAFREGRSHVSTDGRIRVLTSADGAGWQSAALIELDGYDLRDAGLAVTTDGRLMLIGGVAPRKNDNESAPTGAFVSFSSDGTAWTKPNIVMEPARWLWRVTWHKGTAYGVSYPAPVGQPFVALHASDDGTQFRELVPKLLGDGEPNEAVLRFGDDDTMFCLIRRDGSAPRNSAMLGISRPPYTDWQWHDLGLHLGGPNLIQLPSGKWIAAGRILHDDGPKTELARLDVNQKTLTPCLELPSGGDTSYPGLVWHDNMLWVSYYSSHEGKANIYLAKVRVK
jgi:hypothetical protein